MDAQKQSAEAWSASERTLQVEDATESVREERSCEAVPCVSRCRACCARGGDVDVQQIEVLRQPESARVEKESARPPGAAQREERARRTGGEKRYGCSACLSPSPCQCA